MSERITIIMIKCLALVGVVLAGAWGCINLQNGTGIILICILAIFALSDIRIDFK